MLKVLRVWSDQCIYPQDKLKLWYDAFTDLSQPPPEDASADGAVVPKGPVAFTKENVYDKGPNGKAEQKHYDDIDGEPLSDNGPITFTEQTPKRTVVISDDDIDGEPFDDLDGEPLSSEENKAKPKWDDDDLDGVPIDEEEVVPTTTQSQSLYKQLDDRTHGL